eukprot:1172385-Rhodomonas_salina.1
MRDDEVVSCVLMEDELVPGPIELVTSVVSAADVVAGVVVEDESAVEVVACGMVEDELVVGAAELVT